MPNANDLLKQMHSIDQEILEMSSQFLQEHHVKDDHLHRGLVSQVIDYSKKRLDENNLDLSSKQKIRNFIKNLFDKIQTSIECTEKMKTDSAQMQKLSGAKITEQDFYLQKKKQFLKELATIRFGVHDESKIDYLLNDLSMKLLEDEDRFQEALVFLKLSNGKKNTKSTKTHISNFKQAINLLLHKFDESKKDEILALHQRCYSKYYYQYGKKISKSGVEYLQNLRDYKLKILSIVGNIESHYKCASSYLSASPYLYASSYLKVIKEFQEIGGENISNLVSLLKSKENELNHIKQEVQKQHQQMKITFEKELKGSFSTLNNDYKALITSYGTTEFNILKDFSIESAKENPREYYNAIESILQNKPKGIKTKLFNKPGKRRTHLYKMKHLLAVLVINQEQEKKLLHNNQLNKVDHLPRTQSPNPSKIDSKRPSI